MRRRRRFCHGLRSTAVVLLVWLQAPAVASEQVVDDEKIEQQFVQAIKRWPEGQGGLTGRQAHAALQAAEGRKAGRLGAPSPPNSAEARGPYARAREAVVIIGSIEKCEECPDWHMGAVSSGWLAGPDGLVATSYHVLNGEESDELLGAMLSDGSVFPLAEVVAADRDGDAALVRLAASGELPWLPQAARVETGQPAFVVSHPDGRFYSLSKGIVSRVFVGRQEEGAARRTWVTVTADYGAGSSGAPVLNEKGEVVGMVSSTATLLADPEEGKEARPEDVQMVFRDCVSSATIRAMFEE